LKHHLVPPNTGDNIHTARHIARECGILDESAGHICMEGPEFRGMSEEELLQYTPQLRVGLNLKYMCWLIAGVWVLRVGLTSKLTFLIECPLWCGV
jgi:hypothetical protein